MFERALKDPCLVAQTAPHVPIERLCTDRPVSEVRAVLPRVFNLCRAAQSAAFEAALGETVETADIAHEILRDHLLKLFLTWPGMLGMGAHRLPMGWDARDEKLALAVFGPALCAPRTPAEFEQFLTVPQGIVLSKIAAAFAPGEAVAETLPQVSAVNIWTEAAVENSVAARHSAHPVMRHISETYGKGPLWRAAARLYDIEAIMNDALPSVECAGPGRAIAPAARGVYALEVQLSGDQVKSITRITPTDHLLAPGGILEQTLASLPARKIGFGQLVLDILDPCSPVRLREVHNA